MRYTSLQFSSFILCWYPVGAIQPGKCIPVAQMKACTFLVCFLTADIKQDFSCVDDGIFARVRPIHETSQDNHIPSHGNSNQVYMNL